MLKTKLLLSSPAGTRKINFLLLSFCTSFPLFMSNIIVFLPLLFVHNISVFRLSLFTGHFPVHDNSSRHIPSHFSFSHFPLLISNFCSSFSTFTISGFILILINFFEGESNLFFHIKQPLYKGILHYYITSLKLSCRKKKSSIFQLLLFVLFKYVSNPKCSPKWQLFSWKLLFCQTHHCLGKNIFECGIFDQLYKILFHISLPQGSFPCFKFLQYSRYSLHFVTFFCNSVILASTTFVCCPLCFDMPLCSGVEKKWLSEKEKGHTFLFDSRGCMPIFLYAILTMSYRSQKLHTNNVHWNLSAVFQFLKNKVDYRGSVMIGRVNFGENLIFLRANAAKFI